MRSIAVSAFQVASLGLLPVCSYAQVLYEQPPLNGGESVLSGDSSGRERLADDFTLPRGSLLFNLRWWGSDLAPSATNLFRVTIFYHLGGYDEAFYINDVRSYSKAPTDLVDADGNPVFQYDFVLSFPQISRETTNYLSLSSPNWRWLVSDPAGTSYTITSTTLSDPTPRSGDFAFTIIPEPHNLWMIAAVSAVTFRPASGRRGPHKPMRQKL